MRSQSPSMLSNPREPVTAADRSGASVIKEFNSARMPVLVGIWASTMTLFAYAPVAASIARAVREDRRANAVEELLELTMVGVFGTDEQWVRLARAAEPSRRFGWGKPRDTTTFQQHDPLHSTAVYTIVVYSLMRVQELFYRRLNEREREAYYGDAAEGIGRVLAPRGRVPQTFDELRFHYNSIIERHLTVDRRFIELYEQARVQLLTGTPIRDLTAPAVRALPPSILDVLRLTDVSRDPHSDIRDLRDLLPISEAR
ncbi:oxygenase MpaB family protein [Micromonospora sp. WMMD736]|uniref:oxygenase MpaB family protein n=1 Tax=Micromonospora sp. WMMD736 TaxID=3404112 RepID=UPI003B925B08